MLATDGPYLETKEHIGGFWVLEVADLDEALAWGRKAVLACRVRAFLRIRAPFGKAGRNQRRGIGSGAMRLQDSHSPQKSSCKRSQFAACANMRLTEDP